MLSYLGPNPTNSFRKKEEEKKENMKKKTTNGDVSGTWQTKSQIIFHPFQKPVSFPTMVYAGITFNCRRSREEYNFVLADILERVQRKTVNEDQA